MNSADQNSNPDPKQTPEGLSPSQAAAVKAPAAANRSVDPRNGQTRRHHLNESSVQKAVAVAARRAGIVKPWTPHVPLNRGGRGVASPLDQV